VRKKKSELQMTRMRGWVEELLCCLDAVVLCASHHCAPNMSPSATVFFVFPIHKICEEEICMCQSPEANRKRLLVHHS